MSESTVPMEGVSSEMLEEQARARLARADLAGAAVLLQHAARDWNHMGDSARRHLLAAGRVHAAHGR